MLRKTSVVESTRRLSCKDATLLVKVSALRFISVFAPIVRREDEERRKREGREVEREDSWKMGGSQEEDCCPWMHGGGPAGGGDGDNDGGGEGVGTGVGAEVGAATGAGVAVGVGAGSPPSQGSGAWLQRGSFSGDHTQLKKRGVGP